MRRSSRRARFSSPQSLWGKATQIRFVTRSVMLSLMLTFNKTLMPKWPVKSLVKGGLCRRVLVQVSYAIGVSHPLSISIFHYGTSQKSERELLEIVKKNFDLRPGVIVRDLDLKKPIYQRTAAYGHFGRDSFPWEVPKKLKY
uniref:methionine adenosyltransferase n=1 Tax=Rousettus aegyptiacus TaxID=9407 RepID=A0A7J8FLB2_ROUAE|nr:methionine adenosyltransferase 2A [Rousettus aegyptiacus]